eukprot:CAMPEP_0118914996 /NCGR_PEP_ID=MMETSP1166-20130328/15263_1 /TAXON_ID=1104430 /ORGANISM="Chrysoreinhardia sp, Strain CCMP3193" /LENGTH=98 /DNA_ID=CAMNT_0006854635 /DNA_START=29 /DNA_END=321 /DNA_ORIENTATION=+
MTVMDGGEGEGEVPPVFRDEDGFAVLDDRSIRCRAGVEGEEAEVGMEDVDWGLRVVARTGVEEGGVVGMEGNEELGAPEDGEAGVGAVVVAVEPRHCP